MDKKPCLLLALLNDQNPSVIRQKPKEPAVYQPLHSHFHNPVYLPIHEKFFSDHQVYKIVYHYTYYEPNPMRYLAPPHFGFSGDYIPQVDLYWYRRLSGDM